jgi:outer membrane protein assembly factor BamB
MTRLAMSRLGPIAVLAAAAALSACSTVERVGSALNPFDGGGEAAPTARPDDGRVSVLAFEQELTPDPALAATRISVPAAVDMVEWSQPGGVADNSPPNSRGAAVLERAWRADLGSGSTNRVQVASPPVIASGRLYFLDSDHRVIAVDASNGRRLWSQQIRSEARDRHARGGGVAVSGGRVFVTTGYGFMVALDAASGEEVWRTEASAPFHSAPTVAGGRVYAITNDSELIAFDTSDGSVQWNHQAIAEPARILSAPSVAVANDSVIAPFASGELVALLAANGRRLWSDSVARSSSLTSLSAINDIAGRPVVQNGVVYAASHSGLIAAIDLRSGNRIWARNFASTQTPWIAGDVVYAVSTDGVLVALNRESGNAYWVRQLRRFENEENRSGRVAWQGPIMVGGRLILANSVGDVIAVTPENGQTVAEADAGGAVFIPPVVAGGNIYVVTDEARLVVFN